MTPHARIQVPVSVVTPVPHRMHALMNHAARLHIAVTKQLQPTSSPRVSVTKEKGCGCVGSRFSAALMLGRWPLVSRSWLHSQCDKSIQV